MLRSSLRDSKQGLKVKFKKIGVSSFNCTKIHDSYLSVIDVESDFSHIHKEYRTACLTLGGVKHNYAAVTMLRFTSGRTAAGQRDGVHIT